jgi:hypothetical protein
VDVQHTLWIFDAIKGIRDRRFKDIATVLQRLNAAFLANCVGPIPGSRADSITSAVAQLVPTSVISPRAFDAVVFLVRDQTQSLAAKVGGTPPSSATTLGFTVTNIAGGGVAEVYWDLCQNNDELASSIFHEAAHLKSNLGDAMHLQKVGAPHGGPGLRVLSAKGASFASPSQDDLDFYASVIKKPVVLRTRPP